MQYIAFLRGINTARTMKMEDLRRVFESLGYENVRTVQATGNVLFETRKTTESSLTRKLERALAGAFGYEIAVVLRTPDELERLVDAKPFARVKVTPKTRTQVTFLKTKPRRGMELPRGKGYETIRLVDRALCSVVDLSGATTPDLMRLLDKEFGKEVTTRSWNTVEKVVRALG
jgi:uncharacterized protein (DUF1697 family)